jgi:hypothetical protein
VIQCVAQRVEGGVLKVEVDLNCVVKSISIPVKDVRYRLDGGVLVVEVVPDFESILNAVLSK